MRTLALLAFLLFSATLMHAQYDEPGAVVYKTYKDFKAGKGIHHAEYKYILRKGFSNVITFADDKKKTKYSFSDLWAFTWEGGLHRCEGIDPPMLLMIEGEFCYWQSEGFPYFSRGMDGELVPIPSKGSNTRSGKYNDFVRKYPKYSAMYACLEECTEYEQMRACISAQNELSKEGE